MKTEDPPPIPIPFQQRWRDARLRLLPVLVFGASLCALVALWKDHVVPHTMIGQAEPVLANVTCYKPGMLAELSVTRFQRIKAGAPVGKVLIPAPKILASSLAVIQAEIDALQASMR